MNPDNPIRVVEDKILTDRAGNIRQNKCERTCPAELSPELDARLRDYALRAHEAGDYRDYSLFDFRVHEETQECFIIESATFWSFSPISAISIALAASRGESIIPEERRWPLTVEETILNVWENVAKRGRAKQRCFT